MEGNISFIVSCTRHNFSTTEYFNQILRCNYYDDDDDVLNLHIPGEWKKEKKNMLSDELLFHSYGEQSFDIIHIYIPYDFHTYILLKKRVTSVEKEDSDTMVLFSQHVTCMKEMRMHTEF
jgi:hypothetical protein